MRKWFPTAAMLMAAAGALLACPPRAVETAAGHDERGSPTISGPLSLAEAVRIAIENNPSIEASRAAALSARAQVRAVRSSQRLLINAASYLSHAEAPITLTAPSPTLPIGVTSAVPFSYGYAMPMNVEHYGQNIMAALPVYDGGRSRAARKSAVAMQQAAENEVVGTEQQIALRTKEAYFAVLLAQSVAEVQQNEMKEVEERLKDVEERYKNEGAALYEVLRHRAELAQARQQHTNARRDLRIAMIDLNTALGAPLSSEVTLADRLELKPIEGKLEDQLAIAERQSPEIAASEARCTAAEESVKAAKRASRPSVYACVVQANAANIGARGLGGTLGAVMTAFPVFDSGLRRANRQAAESQLASVKATCSDAKRTVQRDVAAAWATLEAAEENARASEASSTEAEESYKAVQLRYEARRATQTEVLDSLAAFVRARLSHIQAIYDYNIARAHLDRAVGRV